MIATLATQSAPQLRPSDIRPRQAGFLRDTTAVAGRALRAIRRDLTAVIPPVFCSSAEMDFEAPLNLAAVEVEVMAARANARMATLYLGHKDPDCRHVPDLTGPIVLVLLNDTKSVARDMPVPPIAQCFDLPIARICTVAKS